MSPNPHDPLPSLKRMVLSFQKILLRNGILHTLLLKHAGSAVVKNRSFSYRELSAVVRIKAIWRPVKIYPWSKRWKLEKRIIAWNV